MARPFSQCARWQGTEEGREPIGGKGHVLGGKGEGFEHRRKQERVVEKLAGATVSLFHGFSLGFKTDFSSL